MKRTPILIISDAGTAGRALLARRDVELRWALTRPEARAGLQIDPKPRVCLTREDLALDVLASLKKEDGGPACVVLVEPEGWARKDKYLEAGATAIVQRTAEEKILEAISGLTGLVFRSHPRVPYSTVADVTMHGDRYFLETVDLSASGVTIRGLTNARIGDRVELTFMMTDPQMSASGVVVRVFEEHGEVLAAISFEMIDAAHRKRLAEMVDEERSKAPELPEPVGLTHDLPSAFTADLHSAAGADPNAHQIYRNMLHEYMKTSTKVVRVPSWLERVARSLTASERKAATGQDVPSYARATLDMRIQLEHCRLDGGPTEGTVAAAIELCRSMANDVPENNVEELKDVIVIRAALLRAVYGAPANESLEIVHVVEIGEPKPTRPKSGRGARP
jgi:hypothetical protein